MTDHLPPKPDRPEKIPNDILDRTESQSVERLETLAKYAQSLAAWKRKKREQERQSEEIGEKEYEELRERDDVSTDPNDYDVPGGAYITVKTTKSTDTTDYKYYYWQWREGNTWKNEYIAPVNPKD